MINCYTARGIKQKMFSTYVHRQPIFVIPSFVNLWWCWQYDTGWQGWAPPKMRCHQPITLVSPISASVWSSLPPNIHLCHITATVSTPLLFSLLNILHCVSSEQPSVHLEWWVWLSTCWCKKWPLSIPQMSSTSAENWILSGDDMWCNHLFWFVLSADTWHMTLCQQRPLCGAWQQLAGYWYITPGAVNSAPLQGSGLV